MTAPINSARNPKLAELRKLRERKHRDRSGLFAAEGEDMLSEALRFERPPRRIFYDAENMDAQMALLAQLPENVERVPVASDALRAVSVLGSGARVIGIWTQSWWLPEAAAGRPDVALYLHDVADPGNVGAVIRSALALVPSIVALSPGTADPFGPKAVRASMGAVFGQPVVRASFESARTLIADGGPTIALVPGSGAAIGDLDLGGPTLFCLGSERLGLPERIVRTCDVTAHVPLAAEGAESLNVAMTATLCLYESAVHRLSATDG